ncbi:efflux RND transporter periplasmic adaptor subunit [Raineyella sp.]|uniref:efflux RND transporter periplasmic adaptor subunit n=1 Tax=Raineyella sp. TaxID=1911550 RepID=UPI002B2036AE|nr:HlyD family efflux transporter periplasmic adaptor subunit [Raineyella sp.]MEA5154245.1 HlyD family efflux transporter periplasmic adaptor subunit [Raineyella sp.]
MNRRRTVIAGAVAVVVIGGAVTAYALSTAGSSATDRYRTTTATRSDLTATVSLSGSLTHVDSVTATFPAAGTVTSVQVHAGQQVKAGDLLATMDTTPLRAALLEAQSQVAAAQLAIEQDRAAINGTSTSSAPTGGQAAASSQALASGQAAQASAAAAAGQARTSGSGTGTGSGGTPGVGTGAAGKTSASQAEIDKALAAVTEAQKGVDGSCQGLLSGLGQASVTPSGQRTATTVADLPSRPATPSISASASPSATPSPTTTALDPKALSACMGALQNLSAAQHRAATVLDAAATSLAQQTSQRPTTPQPPTGPATSTAPYTGTAPKPGTTGRTSTTIPPAGQSGQGGTSSPQAKLLADQGTLAVAQQQQTQAQNNLDGATLTAPISGVVGAVDVSAGNRTTPTKGIVIIGPGAAQVDATASLVDLQQVAVGDRVQVRTVGSAAALDGTLTAVGALPSSGAGTDAPAYPVVVTVPSGAGGLPEGAPSTASIETTSLKNALVIPASALTTTATGATQVTTLGDSGTRTVDVSVGARGQGRVQILSGISGTDVVVLADRTAPLPNTSLTNARIAFRPSSGNGGADSAPAPSGAASPR